MWVTLHTFYIFITHIFTRNRLFFVTNSQTSLQLLSRVRIIFKTLQKHVGRLKENVATLLATFNQISFHTLMLTQFHCFFTCFNGTLSRQ